MLLACWLSGPGLLPAQDAEKQPLLAQIAFLPDVHFHDIFAEFEDGAFPGLPTTFGDGQKLATIRTMEAQLKSTRLFNENYFALLAALDDVVARGIRWVALPGDFSDDGQAVHLRGLRRILDHYHATYGLEFLAAPGNHDPTTPFRSAAGKSDFLGANGRPLPVFSPDHPVCSEPGRLRYPEGIVPHPVFCTPDIAELGYAGVLDFLGPFGLMPKPDYLYFETPYSDYGTAPYHYETALAQASLELRQYEICLQGTGGAYKQPHYTHCFEVADLSYLVEPVEGLWLLAIDANVYVPRATAEEGQPPLASYFQGSGGAGYNRMLTHKQQVIAWIADVVQRAEAQGKTLVAFSHFPMTEFYDGAQALLPDLFEGEGAFQQGRMPTTATSQALARTGLKLHIGGHMHQNDTGVISDPESGNTLVNVQAPSLAAYKPAYKILHLFAGQQAEIETIVLDEVPHFRTLFPHYAAEWRYLDSVGYPRIWNKAVLEAATYAEFTQWHLTELARLRFFPQEWPADLQEILPGLSGWEMLVLSQFPADSLESLPLSPVPGGSLLPDSLRLTWQAAESRAVALLQEAGGTTSDWQWTGAELVRDFYRLQNADELALTDISPARMQQYTLLGAALLADKAPGQAVTGATPTWSLLLHRLRAVLTLINRFSHGEPSRHFGIDLRDGSVRRLE